MAHVLFKGDIRQHPALRSLLWQWGVTVGPLPANVRWGLLASVEDCDAVLIVNEGTGPADHEFGAMPDGAEPEGAVAAAAPLLVMGSEPETGFLTCCDPTVIPDPGPQGCRLKSALESCVEKARQLRGDPGRGHDLDRYRDFVGHELRTPLTAVKTALTALGSDAAADPGTARMLRIARRNLDRLAETVEWSQELHSLAEAGPVGELVPVPVASVTRIIPDHLDIQPENCDTGEVLTDLGLLGILVRQMERVFAFACPGDGPVFRLEIDPDGSDCRLSAQVSGNEAASSAESVSRTGGLARGRTDQPGWNRAEFENLSRMLISPRLLEVLGVRLRIPTARRGTLELSLSLPLWTEAAVQPTDPLCRV